MVGRWWDQHSVRFAIAIGSIAIVFAFLAVSGAHGAAGPVVARGSGDLTGSVLDCTTDTVTLSGSYRYTETGFVNQLADGTWFSHGNLSFALRGVVGIGTSGTSYQVVGATHLDYGFFFGPASPGTDVDDSTQTWTLVPVNGGTPLSFRENFVFVVTPTGSTTLVDHGASDCS